MGHTTPPDQPLPRRSFFSRLRIYLRPRRAGLLWLRPLMQRIARASPGFRRVGLPVLFWVDSLVRESGELVECTLSDSTARAIVGTTDYTKFALFYFGTAQSEIREVLGRVPIGDGWVVDVGANVGEFTLRCAERIALAGSGGSRVIAIEPNPSVFERLRANVSLNKMDSIVDLHSLAASDRIGMANLTLDDPEMNTARGRLTIDSPHESSSVEISVLTTTLDALLAARRQPIRLIKIDVEGAELLALRGAVTVLREDHPTLILEAVDAYMQDFGYTYAELSAFLRANDYVIHVIGADGGLDNEPMSGSQDAHIQRDLICFARTQAGGPKIDAPQSE